MRHRNQNMISLLVFRNKSGGAILEFALIAPVLILVLAAVLDFGLYYLRGQTVNRAVANISHALTLNPSDENIAALRQQEGLGLVSLEDETPSDNQNYLCAKWYATQELAEQGGCEGNVWETVPTGAPLDEYYIAVSAHTADASLTGMFSDILPQIGVKNIVRITDIPQQIANMETKVNATGDQITNLGDANINLGDTINNMSSAISSYQNNQSNVNNDLRTQIDILQQTINNLGSFQGQKDWIAVNTISSPHHGDPSVVSVAMSPDAFCASRGYKFATGECKGVSINMASNIQYGHLNYGPQGGSQWLWGCTGIPTTDTETGETYSGADGGWVPNPPAVLNSSPPTEISCIR